VFPLQLEGQLGVALHQLEQAHLLAAFRHADAGARAAPHGQPLLQQGLAFDLRRDQHLARDITPLRVVLLHGLRQEVLGLGQLVEQVAFARHDLAVAHGEDLQRRAIAFDVGGEEVALLELGGRDLLRRAQPLQAADLVAQRLRLLVALVRRRLLHLRLEPRDHLVRLALEEERGIFRGAPVALGRADLGHAGRDAALDLVLQAGPRPPAVQHLAAGAHAEHLVHDRRRTPAQAGRNVRAPVGVPVVADAAHDVQPRVLLGQRQLQVRMVLVVAEEHVEARPVALDEVVLEGEGLHLAVRHHEVEVADLLDHRSLARIDGTPGLEIRSDAIAQAARLADVHDLPVAVLEQIDPGPRRYGLELFLEGHGTPEGRPSL